MSRQEKIAQFKKQREAELAAKEISLHHEREKLSKWYQNSQPSAREDEEIIELNKRKAALPTNTAEQRQLRELLEGTIKKKVEFNQAMLNNTTREADIKKRMLESRQRQQRLLEDLERVEEKLRKTKEEEVQRLVTVARQEDELKAQMGNLSLLLKLQDREHDSSEEGDNAN